MDKITITELRDSAQEFLHRYGIVLLVILALFLDAWAMKLITERRVTKEVTQRVTASVTLEVEARLRGEFQAYLDQLEQAEREKSMTTDAAIKSAVAAVAPVIAMLNTDNQKQTEVGIMLARVLSGEFANTIEEVALQEGQWPLYDGSDTTYSEHDAEIAETILRPWIERKVIPLDLTKKICWCQWSPNDLIGRDAFEEAKKTVTWRYHG